MSSDESHDTLRATLRHGAVCYLQIPTVDVATSRAFYENVFGWELEAEHPSFEAPGLPGQFVDDRLPVADAGVLVWLSVKSVEETLAAVPAAGESVVDSPSAVGPERVLATILDTAGNALGMVEHHNSGHDGTSHSG